MNQETAFTPTNMTEDVILKTEEAPSANEIVAGRKRALEIDEENDDVGPVKKVQTPRKKKELKELKTPETPETPRTPKTPKSGAPGIKKTASGIPLSWEEAGEADRLLVRMKDEGKSGKEIKAAYEKLTNKTVGGSTLSVRISRLKANFARLADGDDVKLLEAFEEFKEEIAKMEANKFTRIADIMIAKGCQKYTNMLLQKELKKIQDAQMTATYIPGVPGGRNTATAANDNGYSHGGAPAYATGNYAGKKSIREEADGEENNDEADAEAGVENPTAVTALTGEFANEG